MTKQFDRRQLLRGVALVGGGLAATSLFPAWAQSATPGVMSTLPTVSGQDIKLTIGHTEVTVDGKMSHAVTINGTVPGPLIRLKEGQTVRFSVTNTLDEETSIHWHGLLVPFQMDGVPGVSFPGIPAGETFVYEFPVKQSGTYWYHSHSGLQEAEGHYGPLVIEPAGPDPIGYDREHVIVLSDFSFMHPHLIFKRMKQQAGVFNYQKQTLSSLMAGKDQTLQERMDWGKMRMDPTDISDVTGAVMTFLVNGQTGAIHLHSLLHGLAASSPPAYAEQRRDKINETALYGEVTFDATARLSATAGLRWFDFRFDTDSRVTQAAGQRVFNGSDDATGLSPKILVSFDARPGLLFYAQAAEGYRPGGFNTAGRIGQAFDVPGAPARRYQADELWNYELGAKLRGWDDRLQARIAIFYATWESVQSDQYLADGTAYTANIGNGDNRGVEAEAALRLSDQIDLRAAALLNDPEITRQNLDFSSRHDASLPGVSRVSASFGVDYHRPLPGDRILRFQGQATYVGASYLTFDADNIHEMGEYLSLRGVASLEAGVWTLAATMDNPFGAHPNSFSFGNPFLITRDQIITPPRPRTLSVRMSRRF